MAAPTPDQLRAAIEAAAAHVPGDRKNLYLIVGTEADGDPNTIDVHSITNVRDEADRRALLTAELDKLPASN